MTKLECEDNPVGQSDGGHADRTGYGKWRDARQDSNDNQGGPDGVPEQADAQPDTSA
ncbi:MAG TPA: hypothetical protein PK282_10620 [Rhodoglobus sp.]|nr:hypothetical protein [Rhodoglobus sp.]HPM52676.1 hypothetical protein [Rhodoglobus sp.]HQI66753.1 hypothetical protein [Rhodoglobus sp.]